MNRSWENSILSSINMWGTYVQADKQPWSPWSFHLPLCQSVRFSSREKRRVLTCQLVVTCQLDTQFWMQLLRKKKQAAGDSAADLPEENIEMPTPSRIVNASIMTDSTSEKELSNKPCSKHYVGNSNKHVAMHFVGFTHAPSSHALSHMDNNTQPLIAEHPETSL